MSTTNAAENTAPAGAPTVLLVDDDARILELLEIAFGAHGFRVIKAPDGDAAVKRALAERPDLVVLDVKLPKRNGLEVCEWLRRDPDDPAVPVIMVSAVVDPETRLQAFARGADDYLLKPFSPKELIARVKRLLARSAETREARARSRELEHEAARAREEALRAHAIAGREQALRDLAAGPALGLLDACDDEAVADRLLPAFRLRAGSARAALLVPRGDGVLAPVAARGDALGRFAPLALAADGPLAALLAGFDRPVLRHQLERFPELAPELAPFVALGVALLVPLRVGEGLDGLVVLDERRDGAPYPATEIESIGVLARPAASALRNARRVRGLAERALAELAESAAATEPASTRQARAASLLLVDRAAALLGLAARARRVLGHAILLGPAARDGAAVLPLARIAADDPTGFARDVATLVARARAFTLAPAIAPEDVTVPLLAIALAHAGERARGAGHGEALERALAAHGSRLDPEARAALRSAGLERDAAPAA
jgi:CheY-like chemotaxis protein